MNYGESRSLYDHTLSVLADGVNSSVWMTQPYPFLVEHSDGAHVIDADGNRYADHMAGHEPLLYGRDAPEPVQSAVRKHAATGSMYGIPTKVETEYVKPVARHVPSAEILRFVNSGTETTVSTVRLARGATGHDKTVVIQGGYHGVQEPTFIEGGPDGAKPSTSGIPSSFVDHTIPVPLNGEEIAREVFVKHGEDIAAALTESILANTDIIHPVNDYLEALRDMTEAYDAFLVLDEVTTDFRVNGLQRAQGKFGVMPDLTAFGKTIDGDFPVGAVDGKAKLVEQFIPGGDVFQSGTFSGHPVTMVAGHEYLKYVVENDVYGYVDRLGEKLRVGITDTLEDQAPEYAVVGTDSMFKTVFMRHGAIECADVCVDGCPQVESCPNYDACPKTGVDTLDTETDRRECIFQQGMKNWGVFLTANQFESQFASYARIDEDIERTLGAYKAA